MSEKPGVPQKKDGTLALSGITLPKIGPNREAGSYTTSAGNWVLTSLGAGATPTGTGLYFNTIIGKVATEYGISTSQVEIFQLTRDGGHVAYGSILARSSGVTVFVGDNWTENTSGCGYLLSTSEITSASLNVPIEADAETIANPTPAHTHSWTSEPSGLGSNQASAIISCKDPTCGEGIKVSLTASNVTLPGNAFSAKITTTQNPVSRAASPLTVSETPGYKYSPDGSNFTEIDPKTFTPAPGFYQASILIKDGNDTVENLYVTYTVSDPVVTAATGDNRPIEMMVMGMAFFCAMAIAAFVLDSKRRGSR